MMDWCFGPKVFRVACTFMDGQTRVDLHARMRRAIEDDIYRRQQAEDIERIQWIKERDRLGEDQ